MVKRLITIIVAFLLIGSGIVYWLTSTSSAQLAEPVKVQKKQGDFILRCRVEKKDKDFQILCSLENTGKKAVTLYHRAPLISVSVHHNNHDFTGSPVVKEMDSGDVYHPEEPRVLTSLAKGTHTLYIHSQFYANDEIININAAEEVTFQ